MVEIGINNLFIIEMNASSVLNSILDFYELNSMNMIYLKKIDKQSYVSINNISLNTISTIKFSEYEEDDLYKKISDNLFRVNLILIDCNHDFENVIESVRKITDIPIIFTVMNSHLKTRLSFQKSLSNNFLSNKKLFDKAYKLSIEYPPLEKLTLNVDMDFQSIYYVFDMFTNSKQSIEKLKLQSVREFKLNNIFNDEKKT